MQTSAFWVNSKPHSHLLLNFGQVSQMTFQNGLCGPLAAVNPSFWDYPFWSTNSAKTVYTTSPVYNFTSGRVQTNSDNAQSHSVPCSVSTELYQPSANSMQIWALCQCLPLKTAQGKAPRAFSPVQKERLFWKACLLTPIHIICVCFFAHLLLKPCIIIWVCPQTPNKLHVWAYVTFATTVKCTWITKVLADQ